MIVLEDYKQEIRDLKSEDEKRIFIQKHFFHGIPKVFLDRENEYYLFRKRIADQFRIRFYEVIIVGSAKFGFSPYKFSTFSYNSDIDVVIFNDVLFNEFHDLISDYHYKVQNNEINLNLKQRKKYNRFLGYFIKGWMRPDLLPQNTLEFKELKQRWDDFFKEISHSKSEVGNYKVKAGLFKNHHYAEKYYKSSINKMNI